jgi:hypothetical protein
VGYRRPRFRRRRPVWPPTSGGETQPVVFCQPLSCWTVASN